jgi:long-chain acyl-CoA synthetase
MSVAEKMVGPLATPIPASLRAHVEANHQGRKSARGYYLWQADRARRDTHGDGYTPEQQDRLMLRLVNEAVAYVEFDPAHRVWRESTWADTAREVARWQAALLNLGLHPGDRVALMLRNGTAWVVFDQAALGLGLVTVALYPGDRPENVDWVLRDSGARVLLIEGS